MKLTPWRPADSDMCRVDFDYVDFRRAIFQKGVRFWWEYGGLCPCRQITTIGQYNTHEMDTYQPQPNCTGCNGTGVLFSNGQVVRGIAAGYKEMQNLTKFLGKLQPGDIHVTFLREHLPDVNDRYIFLEDQKVYSETRKRTAALNGQEKLRFPVVRKHLNLGVEETETDLPVVTSVGVMWMRKANTSGVLEAQELIEDVHFTITQDGLIDWSIGDASGDAPDVDGYFGVRYHSYPIYKVSEIVHVSRVAPFVNDEGAAVAGDGPIEVILTPQSLGVEDNPTATFMPEV